MSTTNQTKEKMKMSSFKKMMVAMMLGLALVVTGCSSSQPDSLAEQCGNDDLFLENSDEIEECMRYWLEEGEPTPTKEAETPTKTEAPKPKKKEEPKYVTLQSPAEVFLTYHDRSFWTDNEECSADMVEGVAYEGSRAKEMTCYTASNYETVIVTVLDDPEAMTHSELAETCEWSGWEFCQAGPGWIIQSETKDALKEALAPLEVSSDSQEEAVDEAPAEEAPVESAAPEPVEEYTGAPRNLEEMNAWCADPNVLQEDKDIHCSQEYFEKSPASEDTTPLPGSYCADGSVPADVRLEVCPEIIN